MKLDPDSTIVMVDDSEIDRRVVERALARSGLSIPFLAFESGEAFLEFLKNDAGQTSVRVGLVLLDINMPKMSGFSVLTRLRQHPELRDVPVVMMTHSDSRNDMERARALGAEFREKFATRGEGQQFFESIM